MIVLLCLLAAGLGALAGGLWFRRREKRTLEALDRMLDRAAQGTAIQGPLDEGLLSAVETRLGEYLESVGTASQALQEEKDRIKTLVSDIAHQTRTPVANLLLYTQRAVVRGGGQAQDRPAGQRYRAGGARSGAVHGGLTRNR